MAKTLRTAARDNRLEYYNFLFFVLFDGRLDLYRDQYQLFGNPQVMLAKNAFAVSSNWGILANLFMHEKWTDPDFLASIARELDFFGKLITHMRRFFRE